jgi:hypothetical protein
MTIEDRIIALDASVRTELAEVRAKLAAALATELGWGEKYWGYVALAAFVAGILVKALAQ